MKANVGVIHYFGRRYDESTEQLKKIVEEEPDFSVAHWGLGLAFEQKERFEEAISELRKAVAVSGGNLSLMAALGHAYAVSGRRELATKILQELKQLSKQKYVPAYAIAEIHAGLGENDLALHWLEKAREERSYYMLLLKVDPRLESLRSEPRFQALLRRMNFPKESEIRNSKSENRR